MHERCLLGILALGTCATLGLTARDASACGGCFVPPSESTIVTGHRMALALSPTQTVLWDQIQYTGEPAEFSWVLPVRPGTRVELSTDSWFEVLEAATQLGLREPVERCERPGTDDFGCGAPDNFVNLNGAPGLPPDDGVTVVHEGTVGPYETVTLSAEDPDALQSWLDDNGYEIPDAMGPTIDAYVEEGFDFVALKLQPGAGVRQMKPVRIVSSSSSYALPLRMVAAGAGSEVGIVLYVIGEGRYQAQNFPNALVPPALVTWDFLEDESDYAELRRAALSAEGGRTWLTSYAQRGSLLSPIADNLGNGNDLSYPVASKEDGTIFASTIAEAYVHQGIANGEATPDDTGCLEELEKISSETSRVVEGTRASLSCGPLDDVAVALVGLHPIDVTLTRLEATLPVSALSTDLVLEASDDQEPVAHRFVAGQSVNACLDAPATLMPLGGRTPPLSPRGLVGLLVASSALLFAARRYSKCFASPQNAANGTRMPRPT